MQKIIFTFALASLLCAGAARAGTGFGVNPQPPTTQPPVIPPPPQLPLTDPTTPPSTPEPLTMGIFALGAAGIAAAKLRRRRA
ncbi:MAG TPA: PEP-CTERM sorting domain-containing protein [Myxococcales bacterium]|nr:PEP-CTERM sorting domain-containing protein [Myxococcales bacterium]